jgi:hypothetical protein
MTTSVDGLLEARLCLARAEQNARRRHRGERLGIEASRVLRDYGRQVTARIRAAVLRDQRRLAA